MDGIYNESLPIDVALEPMTLLAYGVCEATLPQTHGFPLRIVIPRLLAYKSAKYVVRIELTDHPVEGYWVAAGYDYDGEVPSSRLRAGRY
jgi:DMSO/TMAO reductase YedYZ molybdopterin-dependent catalytic subunit